MTENNPKTPYDLMGGEATVLLLVDKFYFYMDSLPEATAVRGVHAESLEVAQEKLFKFLSGWLGGPDLFMQEFGHPMLRRRHLPFAIGQQERDQWMLCMEKAMDDVSMHPVLQEKLLESLGDLATHMIN
jgi:hemoglobin